MNVEVIEIKPDKRRLLLLLQLVCAVALVIFGAVSLFTEKYQEWVFLLIFINMVVLIINNTIVLKRMKMNIIYIIVAIYFLVKFIMGIL